MGRSRKILPLPLGGEGRGEGVVVATQSPTSTAQQRDAIRIPREPSPPSPQPPPPQGRRGFFVCCLILVVSLKAAHAADLDLSVTLDPDAGRAAVTATLPASATFFSLARDLAATDATIDARGVRPDGAGR